MAEENMEVDFDELIKLETINGNCSDLKRIFEEIVHYHPSILEKIASYSNTDEQQILSHRATISKNFMDLYINYILSEDNTERNFRCLLSTIVFEQLDGITQYNIYRLTKSLNNPEVLTFAFNEATKICVADRTKRTSDDDMLSNLLESTNLNKTAADNFLDDFIKQLEEMSL